VVTGTRLNAIVYAGCITSLILIASSVKIIQPVPERGTDSMVIANILSFYFLGRKCFTISEHKYTGGGLINFILKIHVSLKL
jgi:hypothetical protein